VVLRRVTRGSGVAHFAEVTATRPVAVTDDPDDLVQGFWAVVMTFEGQFTAIRFAEVRRAGSPRDVLGNWAPREAHGTGDWPPLEGGWSSSLDHTAYLAGVSTIRELIAQGTVYQVNLCRILSHRLEDTADLGLLATRLARGNPAPYAGSIDVPQLGVCVVSASPEGFLEREGERLVSRPIKGTSTTAEHLLPKDYAENVMIVDLVRHDLAAVCRPGTIAVDALCRIEEHPGLVHLVSDVSGRLRAGVRWSDILAATFPPGSVSGAPKHTALMAIAELESAPRGPYCGAIGWIDADRDRARLAVGIRSFWTDRDNNGQRWLRFGTGAGITWGSDAASEWDETELKARRLIGLASGRLEP